MSKWQDISTAPKDGTEILLFSRGRERDFIEVGFWGMAHTDEDTWTEARDRAPLLATHWQPLPEPPEGK